MRCRAGLVSRRSESGKNSTRAHRRAPQIVAAAQIRWTNLKGPGHTPDGALCRHYRHPSPMMGSSNAAMPASPARALFGTRPPRAASEASPFWSCGSDPPDGPRPRVVPARVRSRWRAGTGHALGRRPPAATAADPAARPPGGQHPDGPTGSPAGRSRPHDHGGASAHTPPPTQTPPPAPAGAAPEPAARRPERAGHRRGWPAAPQRAAAALTEKLGWWASIACW